MHDRWSEQLSDYLDDELGRPEREALDAHLTGCVSCRALLKELRRVKERAGMLPDEPPDRDLWPRIAREIAPARPRRALAFSVPLLLAAGLALMLVSGGGVWLMARRGTPIVALRPPMVTPASKSEASYAAAIAQLQAALDAGRTSGTLDSTTVRALEHSLATIDSAIQDARQALAADPASAYLNHHLADTMRRKLELLRQASALAAART